jgi:hypothetical protein
MPIPSPHDGESQKDFMSRCMSNEVMNEEFPDQKKRAAVCYSQFRKDKSFFVKAPITKYWEEEIDIEKSPGNTTKSKERFIQVAVSGLKEDRDGEMMSQEAIDDMIMQFKSGTIPFFPDHGFHEQSGQRNVYSWKQMMGVWVGGVQDNEKLLATLRLNLAHPDQEMFWNFVKAGMPLAFSIGGRPIDEPKFLDVE